MPFVRRQLNDDWGLYRDWEYQFYDGGFNHEEVYEWCLHNIGSDLTWMVEMTGVIIRHEEDAVHFALRWC